MAKFYYNGVLLPEIPSDVLAEYPYVVIFEATTKYHAIFSKQPYFYQSSDDTLRNNYGNTTLYWITKDEVQSGLDWYYRNDGWYYWENASSCVVWANYDIPQVLNNYPTIWKETTEPIPEVLEDENWYQITSKTMTDFADEARRIGKVSTPLTPAMMLNIFRNREPEGSLEGLSTGWDVMFYDENNEGLAFYSIKQGHTINPPVYNCKAWQTADGANQKFPFTPSGDVILYANNDTYDSQLYKFFGVDRAVYPYIIIQTRDDSLILGFGKTKTVSETSVEISEGIKKVIYANGTYESITDHSIENVIILAQTYIKPSDLGTGGGTSSHIYDYSGYHYYVNFEPPAFTNPTFYRLDQ